MLGEFVASQVALLGPRSLLTSLLATECGRPALCGFTGPSPRLFCHLSGSRMQAGIWRGLPLQWFVRLWTLPAVTSQGVQGQQLWTEIRGQVCVGLVSSQIEIKEAQVTEAQAELERAKADLRTHGESKSKRYAGAAT